MTTKTKTAVGAPDPDETPAPLAEADSALTSPTNDAPLAGAGPVMADRFVFLDGLSPVEALKALSPVNGNAVLTTGELLVDAAGERVRVAATPGSPLDQVVVGDHAYHGQWVDGHWRFYPPSLEMACRVAGWSTVERYGDGWLLS